MEPSGVERYAPSGAEEEQGLGRLDSETCTFVADAGRDVGVVHAMKGEEGRKPAIDEHQGEVQPQSDTDEACEADSGDSTAALSSRENLASSDNRLRFQTASLFKAVGGGGNEANDAAGARLQNRAGS